MGIQNPKNVGSHIRPVVGIVPVAYTATVNPKTSAQTPSYDRSADNFPLSMSVHLNCGQTSSNPSVATAQAVVYHSDDNTTFTAYVPPPIAGAVQTGAATAALDCSTAINSAILDVDLSGAKRYIALKLVLAFTGGTTPAIIAAATMVPGGSSVEPMARP